MNILSKYPLNIKQAIGLNILKFIRLDRIRPLIINLMISGLYFLFIENSMGIILYLIISKIKKVKTAIKKSAG